jgi:hypothetical protein
MPVDKIDANITGLRYAMETSLKTVSGSAVWYPLEPNSYDSFGPEFNKIARRPIGPTRQRRKGVMAGIEVSAGFNQDLTFTNLTRVLQSFFFAALRENLTTKSITAAQVPITAIDTTDDSYAAASGMPAFKAGDLILVSGATNAGNNGLMVVLADATSTKVTTSTNLVTETPVANSVVIRKVGRQFASATLDVAIVSGKVQLNRASGAVDYTTLGYQPGEWIFIGGDGANTAFANNIGWGRIELVTATYIQLDKTTFTPQAETGTGKTINIFEGELLKNETTPSLIVPLSIQLERTLGDDGSGVQSEYCTGCFANELTFNFPEEDKINIDLSFVALGYETRTGATGVKPGTRPTNSLEEAYNTTVDTTRFRMVVNTEDTTVYTPLFNYASEATITINNNVSMNKALTVFGGFNATAGLFEVGGDVDAYFTSVTATQAIINNTDVSMEVLVKRSNQAILFELPCVQLGDGQLEVEIDEPIKLPLSNEATQSKFDTTMIYQQFYWIPTLAG